MILGVFFNLNDSMNYAGIQISLIQDESVSLWLEDIITVNSIIEMDMINSISLRLESSFLLLFCRLFRYCFLLLFFRKAADKKRRQ